MSKAFTSEETPDDRPIVPPRAALPPGVPNYVTPRGLALLRAEHADLETQRQALLAPSDDDPERRRRLEIVGGRLAALAARIASARVVEPPSSVDETVRFGATVTLRSETGEERRFTIVGVDEAEPVQGRIAFVAPIARAVMGRRPGDTAVLRTAKGEEELEVVGVAYERG